MHPAPAPVTTTGTGTTGGDGAVSRPRTVEEIRAVVMARRGRKQRQRVQWPPELMADLWRLPEAAPFLADGTVRAVYGFLRHVSMSQRDIAAMVGQSQSEVSEIMAGRNVQSVTVLARIAAGLCLPPATFGLAPSRPDVVTAQVDHPDPGDGRPDPEDGEPDPVDGGAGPVFDVVSTSPFPARGEAHAPHGTSQCLCAPPAAPLVQGHVAVPVVPLYWTGVELRGLRLCVHMSVRQFAAAIGVSARMVSKWEAGGADMIPRPHHQATADTVLSRALPIQQARFAGWLLRPHPTPAGTGPDDRCRPQARGQSTDALEFRRERT